MTIRIDNTSATEPTIEAMGTNSSVALPSSQSQADRPALLPDPVQQMAGSGDMLAELVALLTLASRSDRDAARKAERAEDMIRTQQEQQKVAKMHEQADDIRGAAWATGLAEIGQGACELGATLSTQVNGKFDWNDGFKFGRPAFKGGGDLVAGQYKAMEKLDAADAEEANASADRAGRGAKEASEDVDSARDSLKKITSFYEQMLQAQTGALNAAANRRA
jgi:hypothetical protein